MGVRSRLQAGRVVKEGRSVMSGCELPFPSWMVSEEGWTSLDSPECFPAVQVVKAGEAESTSCEGASGGQGCVEEPELEIWPGIWLRV